MESFPLEIEFLTPAEVMETCHVSRQTLWLWGKNPFLCFPPALKLGPGKGGAVRYRLSHLLEWTHWLRAQANAKAAGKDPNEVPKPSYVSSEAWQSGVLKLDGAEAPTPV
jgi:predicted DNA-binding transcriptional regulator AlpA